MILRLPDSGSWLGAWLGSLGRPAMTTADGTSVDDVDAELVRQATEALMRGDIEFVILEDGDAFLQVAGDGDGPYQVQHQPGGDQPMLEMTGGVAGTRMQAILLEYLAGDIRWRTAHQWVPM